MFFDDTKNVIWQDWQDENKYASKSALLDEDVESKKVLSLASSGQDLILRAELDSDENAGSRKRQQGRTQDKFNVY